MGMLARGARGRLADILTRGSCGEGGTKTAVAIHNNDAACCYPPMLEARGAQVVEGRKTTREKHVPSAPTKTLMGLHGERIAEWHVDGMITTA